ncbi:MAG: T9SS type A sorting domain-containing protein, partial [Saprospiraceae bacterium]|nr:T9SS type A sorting domain-containing protein [Saprospiraceae bacterium]
FGTGANEPFFGGAASGDVFATLAGNCPSSIFEGGDSSGHFIAEFLQACPSGIFRGDSLSGYASNDLDGGQDCRFFKGEEGSGAQVEEYKNPYTCVQFFATASGGDGAAQRSYSDDNTGCIVVTFPIEGSPLFAKVVGNRGRLYWWTYTELNNEGFEVQKSNDGSDWEQIAWVNGAGNSLSEIAYEVWDNNLNQGVQYYRYIQYDFDGTEHVSNTVALEYNLPNQDLAKDEVIQLSVFPNPLLKGNNLKIKSWYSGELSTRIRVYNLLGQELLTQTHAFSPTESLIELATQDLPQGTYVTTIKNKSLGILKTIKFIVID